MSPAWGHRLSTIRGTWLKGIIPRPAETLSAIVALVVAAGLNVYGFAIDEAETLIPQIAGVLVGLVGWVAATVTAFVAKQQRDPSSDVTSAADGTVVR